jgi:hypothetical protein
MSRAGAEEGGEGENEMKRKKRHFDVVVFWGGMGEKGSCCSCLPM